MAELCNLYLERQESRVAAEEVGWRHFTDNLKSCKKLVEHFRKFTRAASLRAVDFKNLRAAFPDTWGAAKIGNEIQRARTVFKWGAESELIPAMPNFRPDFKKPSRTVARREQQQKQAERGSKLDFSADEIQTLLGASTGWMHACILLGINGGMGNSDCGRLSTTFLDLKSGWYDLARQKTGVPRRFRIWPETIAAMMDRKIPKHDEDAPLCFLTSHAMPIWWEVVKPNGETYMRDNITQAFTKLCKTCGVSRSGRGFYSLRRTFETVADNTKDHVAVDYVMGHFDESMAALYRQGIDDQRLVDVANHVHAWLFPKRSKKPATKKPAKSKRSK